MAWDGFIIHPTDFVGNSPLTPLNQMGRECSSLEATWNHQDDEGFNPSIISMKGLSTTLKVEYEIYLIDMNYAVIVSWGVSSQRFWAVFILWKIYLEPTMDFVSLELSFASSLNHLSWNFSAQLHLGIDSPPSKSIPFFLSSTCAWRFLPCLLRNFLLLIIMDNRKKAHNEPRAMNSQDLFAGQVQHDLEKDCAGCQRMRIHMGAINSTLTFELETLSLSTVT
jgi:hypothetical protein